MLYSEGLVLLASYCKVNLNNDTISVRDFANYIVKLNQEVNFIEDDLVDNLIKVWGKESNITKIEDIVNTVCSLNVNLEKAMFRVLSFIYLNNFMNDKLSILIDNYNDKYGVDRNSLFASLNLEIMKKEDADLQRVKEILEQLNL